MKNNTTPTTTTANYENMNGVYSETTIVWRVLVDERREFL